MHVACLAVLWVGISPIAIAVALALYAIRMFALTGFYHRYFAHRTFRTSRTMQFVFALIGASSAQRGPLWWAAQHRHHHRHADTPLDWHSPRHRSLAHCHVGWFLTPAGFRTDRQRIPDLIRFPELRWLDRFDTLVPICLALALFYLGAVLDSVAPHLGTSGWQLLAWGFCISTVALFHASVTINSLSHRFGSRRFDTPDDSRNNALLALLTLGEGWHNNHHFCPGCARQGFHWWELEVTYYGLRLLAALGGLWGLRLAVHLWQRVRKEPEDGRYRYLRTHWQGRQGMWFLFFQFQALLVVLFSLPFLAVAANLEESGWLLAGMAIWVASVVGEGIADRQLARFRADTGNRGRTCRAGLWRYSRHPNYFFEWLHWLSYAALAVGSPLAWLAWSGPVLMYVFLRWVSGIPFTEAQALRTRGEDYRQYQATTPMLFPWFPKRHR